MEKQDNIHDIEYQSEKCDCFSIYEIFFVSEMADIS